MPIFSSTASVHDPSIVQDGEYYYVFGSHAASAWSPDLINWYQYSTHVAVGNPLFPDPFTELSEAFDWTGADTLWAPDVYQLPDGTWAYYYCASEGSSPRGLTGIAESDTVLGPYTDRGVLLRSGMWGQVSPDGTIYDATRHPHAVDPAMFNDPSGGLWMAYGSYSGGIFVMEMDRNTGVQLDGQGYGTKIMGGNHARIEGAYVVYHPETQYYYMFVSFGGLGADGAYNIRVARSTTPEGPYFDAAGQDMIAAKGAAGTIFDDVSIAPYGAKLMGNYQFLHAEGEPYTTSRGYVSPGHNSVLHDAATGKWFNVFHTRFVGRDEQHEVRVHQVFFSEDGWPVVAPHRYAGETIGTYTAADIAGSYKVIHHGTDVSTTVKTSTEVELLANGTLSGTSGTWSLSGDHYITITMGGVAYKGVVCRMWDDDNRMWVDTFSALAPNNAAIWGSAVAIPERSAPYTPIDLTPVAAQAIGIGETLDLVLSDRQDDTPYVLEYALREAPAGTTINPLTGQLTFTPLLSQQGQTFTIRAQAHDVLEPEYTDEVTFNVYVGAPIDVAQSTVTFTGEATGGILDQDGTPTGFTTRLGGTGGTLATHDPKLNLDTTAEVLEIRSSQADFAGQAGMAGLSAPGLRLSDFGFTGDQDFVIRAEFAPVVGFAFVDQLGLYVGTASTNVTRAGFILLDAPQAYSAHTPGTQDAGAHFSSFIDVSDGLSVVIARQNGAWSYFVDGVSTHPTTGEATFLNGQSDLTFGVFAITPLNADVKTAQLQSLTVMIENGDSSQTDWAQWVITHFGANPLPAVAAQDADPDVDGLPNLIEYATGTDPMVPDANGALQASSANGMLSLSFDRIADPALRYYIEASDDPTMAEWPHQLWSSAGSDNAAGKVALPEVAAPSDSARYFRLRVETVE